ncbi:hypothetical protein WHX55_27740 [Pseudomonas fluorescens]|uniref:hypothetical protein n=1 Tax=Pseudomonas fluorescens TaxID=294 RepID=UPI00324DC8D5
MLMMLASSRAGSLPQGVVQNAGISKGVVQNKTGPMPSFSTQWADLKPLFPQQALA